MQGDITKLSDLDRLYSTVRDEVGHINVLLANAGGGASSPLHEISEEHFDRTFASNVKGTLFTAQQEIFDAKFSSKLLRSSGLLNI